MIPVAWSMARIRLLLVSAMNTSPAALTATPAGRASREAMAAPPSPAKPKVPSPATVLIVPVPPSTFRMRWLPVSAMKMFPAPSTVTPLGPLRSAAEAGPPSPAKPLTPVPTTVVITPLAESTRRSRAFCQSTMKTLPALSSATPLGPLRAALSAGPPSPLKPGTPVPARTVIWPLGSTLKTRWAAWAATKKFPEPSGPVTDTGLPRAADTAWTFSGPPPA